MTEIMPVPRNLILLSYQQGALPALFLTHGGKIGVQTEQFCLMGKDKRQKLWYTAKQLEMTNLKR